MERTNHTGDAIRHRLLDARPGTCIEEKNALFIEVEKLINVDVHHTLENYHFNRSMMWAEPSYLDLAKKMRLLFTDKKLGINLGDSGRRTVEHHHQIAFTGIWIEKNFAP